MTTGARASELVVLTQNAWGGAALWPERRQMLARRIGQVAPDVVGLQEVHVMAARFDQAEELARLAGGYRAWYAPGRVARDGACEGVALLVRDGIEVCEHSVEALTLDRNDPFEGDSQRIVLRAAIRLGEGGAVIDVLVTHLSLSRRARARTIRELVAFAARERAKSGSAGAIMMGDLNAVPEEEAIQILESDRSWLDAWRHAHPRSYGGTWPAGVPLRRLDYIFVQPGEGWSIQSCERTHFSGSDHLGVMARIHVALP